MARAGFLYLVGTPIGNLKDVTRRALETLAACDVIYCEDTRVSRKLLSHYGLHKPTSSFHGYSGEQVLNRVRRDLAAGKAVAYVTDAGMPGLADPGPELVRMCLEEGFAYDVIPGPSALASALSFLPVHAPRFTFLAFPGKKRGQLQQFAQELARCQHPAVVFVGPHHCAPLVQAACQALPPGTMVLLCRELTKAHQEVKYLPLAELAARMEEGIRGELTLIFVPPAPVAAADDGILERTLSLQEVARKLLGLGLSARDARRILEALFPGAKAAVRRAVYNKQSAGSGRAG